MPPFGDSERNHIRGRPASHGIVHRIRGRHLLAVSGLLRSAGHIRNNHPAIIDRDTCSLVQAEIFRRISKTKKSEHSVTEQGKYSGKYAWTELLICGECGSACRRTCTTVNGAKIYYWRSINRIDNGKKFCKESRGTEEKNMENKGHAITYTEKDGIYYPDLKLPEQTHYPIGKYGDLRLDYIQKHRKGLYTTLLAECKLNEYPASKTCPLTARLCRWPLFSRCAGGSGTTTFVYQTKVVVCCFPD